MLHLLKKYPLYRQLIVNNMCSKIGDSIYYIALLTFAHQFKQANLAITLVSCSEILPHMFALVIGSYADLSPHKISKSLWTSFLRGLIYLTVGILIGFSPSLLLLCCICFLNILSDSLGSFSNSALTPFVPHIVKPNDLEHAQGLNGAIQTLISTLAFFLGSVLIGIFSFRNLAWINSATFFGCFFLLFLIRHPLQNIEEKNLPVTQNHGIFPIIQQIKIAVKSLYHKKELFYALLLFSLLNGILAVTTPILSMYFTQYPNQQLYNFSLSIALIEGVIALFSIGGSLMSTRLFKKTALLFLCCISFIACFFYLFAFLFNHLFWGIFFLALLALLSGICTTKLTSFLLSKLPSSQLGTIMGATNMLLMLVPTVTTIIFTSLASGISLTFCFYAMLLFCLSSLLLAVICLRFFK
ncbi:MFS transporter [Vagococcus entomophilus]|uniref:Major facilitator superfamily (MFS) profile domain-containing protein n=1 Tax=Vagococcus entomophilus TaxID=1160095 RepID=A0A430AI08_9ENTE|nr:MFS transporter [Vagococcus entomophilus]RSU07711.1 hypothetical protein CBF30_00270 [Vagococcus entomophilus]